MKKQQENLTHEEVSLKGGETTKKRHGKAHYDRISRMGGNAHKKDPDFFKRISAKGVEARRRKKLEREQQELENKRPINQLARTLTGK